MKPKAHGPEVSPDTRREIIGLHKDGMKYPTIEEELGVKADTCRKIMNRCDNGHQSNSAPCSGRPKKLDDHDRRHLEHYITKNRW
jgi:transposase